MFRRFLTPTLPIPSTLVRFASSTAKGSSAAKLRKVAPVLKMDADQLRTAKSWESFLPLMTVEDFLWNAFDRKGHSSSVLALDQSGRTISHDSWESAFSSPDNLTLADEHISELDLSSVIKKRKRAMKHHKHRKLLKKTRHLRRKLGR